ncbi:hypothetical protein Vretimale_18814 [Volvox reticuliferus]|uniref:Uncharacterized protein n=1 Tax=Volvox reticuliferus TaxID=1737510 RepID=A0A8J4CYB0_9CHLO|nr:hypothetical protein Vretifemale_18872 [Volvox reticuliferus]GIM16164.1 hypothetical protein Vretimale_18814 [Volvox reticuliferus]
MKADIRKMKADTRKMKAECRKMRAECRKMRAECRKRKAECRKRKAEWRKMLADTRKMTADTCKMLAANRKMTTDIIRKMKADENRERKAGNHEMKAEYQEVKLFLAKSNVRRVLNTAATRILLAADGQEFKKTRCTRFKVRGASDSGVKEAAMSLLDGLYTRTEQEADAVMTHCNKEDESELAEEVAEVVSLLTPALVTDSSPVGVRCGPELQCNQEGRLRFPDSFEKLALCENPPSR